MPELTVDVTLVALRLLARDVWDYDEQEPDRSAFYRKDEVVIERIYLSLAHDLLRPAEDHNA
jgi:hypothetical protein